MLLILDNLHNLLTKPHTVKLRLQIQYNKFVQKKNISTATFIAKTVRLFIAICEKNSLNHSSPNKNLYSSKDHFIYCIVIKAGHN